MSLPSSHEENLLPPSCCACQHFAYQNDADIEGINRLFILPLSKVQSLHLRDQPWGSPTEYTKIDRQPPTSSIVIMDSSVGTSLVRGVWAAMAIAVIIVALRVYAKIKIHQFRADDVLMVISMVRFAFNLIVRIIPC